MVRALVFLCSVSALFAQEQSQKKKDIPKAILNAFQSSYPGATITGYAREAEKGKVTFEIESVEGKIHRDISYTADGSAVSIEESLPYKELPEPVRYTISSEYPRAKILSCEKVTEGQTVRFELAVRTGKKRAELVFDVNGTLMKKEAK